MPDALRFLVGLDTGPFQAEIRKLDGIARASSRSIASQMAAGAHGGYSGIVRESIVIGREIAMGRGGGRIVGSATILLGYLTNLIRGTKEAGSAANATAQAYDIMAAKQANIGKALFASRSGAIERTLVSGGSITDAKNMARAVEAQATAHLNSAAAFRAKAVAASEAAAAEEIEALAAAQGAKASGFQAFGFSGTGGMMMVGLATLALATGVIYEHWVGVKNAIKNAGMEMPKLADEYVPKLSRHTADAVNSAEKLADAIARATREYRSANAEAERQAEALDELYTFKEQMNDLEKEEKLAAAKTPAEKMAVEKEFSNNSLALQKEKHMEELSNMATQSENLENQKNEALSKKDSTVLAAPEEAALLRNEEINAKAGEAHLNKDPSVWQNFKDQAAIQLGSTTGADAKNIEAAIKAAEEGGEATAQAFIKIYHKGLDKKAAHDKIRTANEELQSEADKAAADKATVDLKMRKKAATFDVEEQHAADMAAERLRGKQAQMDKPHGHSAQSLNSLQRIGGQHVVSVQSDLLGETRRIGQHVRKIAEHHERGSHHPSGGLGAARF